MQLHDNSNHPKPFLSGQYHLTPGGKKKKLATKSIETLPPTAAIAVTVHQLINFREKIQ